MVKAIMLVSILSLEPEISTQSIECDEIVLERKRSHKRRRKIRRPIRGLR